MATPGFWADAGECSFQMLYLVMGLEFIGVAVLILLRSHR
jgi:hypothetical protein